MVLFLKASQKLTALFCQNGDRTILLRIRLELIRTARWHLRGSAVRLGRPFFLNHGCFHPFALFPRFFSESLPRKASDEAQVFKAAAEDDFAVDAEPAVQNGGVD
ncbi:MAG: hypothetical protein M3Y13_07140, partial [Armatimonadota bacterium]|nr:hypothetical protein [Armatimonadota bacterium]